MRQDIILHFIYIHDHIKNNSNVIYLIMLGHRSDNLLYYILLWPLRLEAWPQPKCTAWSSSGRVRNRTFHPVIFVKCKTSHLLNSLLSCTSKLQFMTYFLLGNALSERKNLSENIIANNILHIILSKPSIASL